MKDEATAYKLTNQDLTTYNGFQWVAGRWHRTDGVSPLCGPGWIHLYSHPLLAVLLNPIHANFRSPHLWRCEVAGAFLDDHGLKHGRTAVRLMEEMPLPQISTEQRVRFGILCAKEVYAELQWAAWADRWLAGVDRGGAAARAAEAAWAAARAAEAAWAARAAEAAAAAAWAAQSKALNFLAIAKAAIAGETGHAG